MSSLIPLVVDLNQLIPIVGTSSAAKSQPAQPVTTRRLQPRDHLHTLANLLTQALAEKLSQDDGKQLLRGLLSSASRPKKKRGITIARLIDQFLDHADTYYPTTNGTTSEAVCIRRAVKPLRQMLGRTRAEDFRPLRLKAVRDEMIKLGWCRKQINQNVGRVKRMFKWGVENELIPADRYHALQAVPGLKFGRTTAREMEPVKPVPMSLIEATLPHVCAQVAAMIRLQLLTGMRPGEVLIMRTCDIDRSGEIWIYRPRHHKTAHHNHRREVYLGPQAQALIQPYLKCDQAESHLFSPHDADEEFRRKKHAARKTPMSCGNVPGSNCKRRPRRKPGQLYQRSSYTRAINRACKTAFPTPAGLSDEHAKQWRREHHWHPHQLRHNAATQLRKDFGIDSAQVILGHKTLAITEIYAEKNVAAAIEIMKKVG